MPVLYGNVDISKPESTEYFTELKGYIAEQEKGKKDRERARLEAIRKIPTTSTTNQFDSHYSVSLEMTQALQDGLTAATESPEAMAAWEANLDKTINYIDQSTTFYEEESVKLLEGASRNINLKEWEDQGIRDEKTNADYEAILEALDDPTSLTGIPIEDHFDNTGHAPRFIPTQFVNPEDWWPKHKVRNIASRDEATRNIKARIVSDAKMRRDALRWHLGENPDVVESDLDVDDHDRILTEYAEEAAKQWAKDEFNQGGDDDEVKWSFLDSENFTVSDIPWAHDPSTTTLYTDPTGKHTSYAPDGTSVNPQAESLFTFPSEDRVEIFTGGESDEILSISYDGHSYTMHTAKGENIDITKNLIEDGSHTINVEYNTVSGLFASDFGGGALDEIMQKLYDMREAKIGS